MATVRPAELRWLGSSRVVSRRLVWALKLPFYGFAVLVGLGGATSPAGMVGGPIGAAVGAFLWLALIFYLVGSEGDPTVSHTTDQVMHCSSCGAEQSVRNVYCTACGEKVRGEGSDAPTG